jgi:hypothetical protein
MVMEDPAEQLSPRNQASRETFVRQKTKMQSPNGQDMMTTQEA